MSCLYFENTDDPFQATRILLNRMKPFDALSRKSKIILKPNLVVSKPSSSGATTDPRIAEAVIVYLKDLGFSNISIRESSWIGDDTKKAFKVCGYVELSEKYGIPLFDLKGDTAVEMEFNGFKTSIFKSISEADYLINLPLIKGHCQTKITCALKNLKGCIPDSEKRRFHSEGLHRPIACLNGMIKQNLIIADGFITDPGFEEGGNPKQMGIIAISDDPVMMDSFAAFKLGFHPDEIKYLKLCREYGFGTYYRENSGNDPIVRADENLNNIRIHQENACSNCYSNLLSALKKINSGNHEFREDIYIGQSYKGKTFSGTGIGDCCKGASHFIPGCPPSTDDIYMYLADKK
ncbi:MAG: DUF362 domain-containing protein [Spirochaetes bacterium]|nr:DUF362 domain-containing protein [Spirochaetota bacterium]